MPYRTPPKPEDWTFIGWLKGLFGSAKDQVQAIRLPKCQLPEGACEFKAVEVEPGWDNRNHDDILYYDEPISGSKEGGFYYGMLVPHKHSCKHCKRPFRVGDKLPKGASLDYWKWAEGNRRRPEYLSELEWRALESSGYFK